MLRTFLVIITLLLWIAIPSLALAEKIVLVAGGGNEADGGLAIQARLIEPFGIGYDKAGNLYIVQMEGGERVRRVDRQGRIATVAGTGEKGYSGDGGPATGARLNDPHHLLVMPDGDILLADTYNNRIRLVNHRTGIIETIAGTGIHGYSGDGGPALRAQFGNIYCLALSPDGKRLYICDLDNRRIRMMDRKTGLVCTVAGNGQKGTPIDGQVAVNAPLDDPRAIAMDSQSRLYILERGASALRVVTSDGKIRTLLGAPGQTPLPGIGPLNGPKHLCIDRNDRVIIADTENHRIVRFDPRTRQEMIVAGSGKSPVPGQSATADLGGSIRDISLNRPHGVYVDRTGALTIADSDNGRVLTIFPFPMH